MNDEGDCRTAPATPGLLKTLGKYIQDQSLWKSQLLFFGRSAPAPAAAVNTTIPHCLPSSLPLYQTFYHSLPNLLPLSNRQFHINYSSVSYSLTLLIKFHRTSLIPIVKEKGSFINLFDIFHFKQQQCKIHLFQFLAKLNSRLSIY